MQSINELVTVGDLRSGLSEYLGRAQFAGQRIGVTKHGKVAVVIVSADDVGALNELVTVGELRTGLSDFLGRVQFAGQQIGVTRHGKVAAAIISPAVLAELEQSTPGPTKTSRTRPDAP